MTNRYERETSEFQAVRITVDGAPITEGVELSVVPKGARPDTWTAATELDGEIGFMVDGYDTLPKYPAAFSVWTRVTSNPEIPVQRAGEFIVA